MTPEEYSQKLSAVCTAIVHQNRELMREMDEPDFDPAIRLDNTKNNAGYMLTDFFDILQYFPHGSVPDGPTDELVTSTDELLAKIRTKYGGYPDVLKEIIRAGQAFRNSKRIWRIKAPVLPLSQADYKSQLDAALNNILRALDDLNYELNLMTVNPPPQPATKVTRKPVSVADAAHALNVSKSTISNWEHGRCPVGLDYPGREDSSIFYFWARNYKSRKEFHRKARMHAIHLNNS